MVGVVEKEGRSHKDTISCDVDNQKRTQVVYIYIYIYIEREREREKLRRQQGETEHANVGGVVENDASSGRAL